MEVVMRRMGRPGDRGAVRRLALAALALLLVAGTVVALVRAGGDRLHRDASTASSSAPAGSAGKASVTPSPAAPAPFAGDRSSASAGAATDAGAPASTATRPGVAETVPDTPTVGTAPHIVRTAEMAIRVRSGSFASAVERATAVASTTGGYVTSSSTSSFEKGRASGELTLRVPSDRFDDARRQLDDLGTVESVQTGGQDVGGQLVDLDARLRTLQAEEGALDELLARSGDVGQILQVRDRLTGVRTEIEQLAGEQAALKQQVALATIHVSLHESATPPVRPVRHHRTGLAASVATAVDALLAVVGGTIIVLGALLPFLVLGLLAWPLARRYGRRHAEAG